MHLKTVLLANTPLAIMSLFLGYSFWYMASYDHAITLHIDVPLYFSNASEMHTIHAPEKITVALKGKRADLYALDQPSLAAHINASELLPGKHGILLTDQHLFLSKSVSLAHYKPTNLTITIEKITVS